MLRNGLATLLVSERAQAEMQTVLGRKRTHCFSDSTIAAVRRALRTARTQREVARAFGMSDAYVSQIKRYRRRINMREW